MRECVTAAALDHPAARQDNEALYVIAPLDDLQAQLWHLRHRTKRCSRHGVGPAAAGRAAAVGSVCGPSRVLPAMTQMRRNRPFAAKANSKPPSPACWYH